MMTGKDGRQSFTKWIVLILLAMHAAKVAPGVIAEGMLLAAAFGKQTFLAWLARGQWSASDTVEAKSITERRINVPGEPGIEPA